MLLSLVSVLTGSAKKGKSACFRLSVVSEVVINFSSGHAVTTLWALFVDLAAAAKDCSTEWAFGFQNKEQ